MINDILLHSQINLLSCHHQRRLLSRQMAVGVLTHSQTLCEESKLEVSSGFLHLVIRESYRRVEERL